MSQNGTFKLHVVQQRFLVALRSCTEPLDLGDRFVQWNLSVAQALLAAGLLSTREAVDDTGATVTLLELTDIGHQALHDYNHSGKRETIEELIELVQDTYGHTTTGDVLVTLLQRIEHLERRCEHLERLKLPRDASDGEQLELTPTTRRTA